MSQTHLTVRQQIERAIVTAVVDAVLAAGKRLAVSLERGYDPDEMLLGSTDRKKIIKAAMAGDDAHIFVQPADGPTIGEDGTVVSEGWVYFVFGNDGYDVINDHTTGLTRMLKPVDALAKRFEKGEFNITART